MKLFRVIREIAEIGMSDKKRQMFTVPEFAHTNRKLLIIVCDPATDEIFVGYKDRFAKGKIKSAEGGRTNVVKSVLRASKFEKSIGNFIAVLTETLGLKKMLDGNQLFQFLDGALYRIAGLKKKNE